MNDVFPIYKCLKSSGCIAFLGNQMGGKSAFILKEYFNIERAEGFVEFRVWIGLLFLRGEGEREDDGDPGQSEIVSLCAWLLRGQLYRKLYLYFPRVITLFSLWRI